MQKKICLIGPIAVGKTSLVSRFVRGIFPEKYLTTIGVKVDTKTLTLGDQEITLLVWDMAGDDRFGTVKVSYMRGAAGYLLVADGTRRSTLETAAAMQQHMIEGIGDIPFIVLLNKSDLQNAWEISESDLAPLVARGWRVVQTSAKSGDGVEEAFAQLAAAILAAP